MYGLFVGQNVSLKHHWVHRLRQRGRCKHCGKVLTLVAAVFSSLYQHNRFNGSFPRLFSDIIIPVCLQVRGARAENFWPGPAHNFKAISWPGPARSLQQPQGNSDCSTLVEVMCSTGDGRVPCSE